MVLGRRRLLLLILYLGVLFDISIHFSYFKNLYEKSVFVRSLLKKSVKSPYLFTYQTSDYLGCKKDRVYLFSAQFTELLSNSREIFLTVSSKLPVGLSSRTHLSSKAEDEICSVDKEPIEN